MNLAFKPENNVVIAVSGPAGSDLTIDKTTLTFTSSNWKTQQAVKVTAAEDDDADDDTGLSITHTATSSDSNYSG